MSWVQPYSYARHFLPSSPTPSSSFKPDASTLLRFLSICCPTQFISPGCCTVLPRCTVAFLVAVRRSVSFLACYSSPLLPRANPCTPSYHNAPMPRFPPLARSRLLMSFFALKIKAGLCSLPIIFVLHYSSHFLFSSDDFPFPFAIYIS